MRKTTLLIAALLAISPLVLAVVLTSSDLDTATLKLGVAALLGLVALAGLGLLTFRHPELWESLASRSRWMIAFQLVVPFWFLLGLWNQRNDVGPGSPGRLLVDTVLVLVALWGVTGLATWAVWRRRAAPSDDQALS